MRKATELKRGHLETPRRQWHTRHMCWVVSGSVSVVFIFSFLNFGKKNKHNKKLEWVEVSSFKQSGILTGKLTFFILPPYCTTAFSRSPLKKSWAQIFPAWCHPKRPCSKKTRLSFEWLYVLQLGSKPPYMKSEHKKQQKTLCTYTYLILISDSMKPYCTYIHIL